MYVSKFILTKDQSIRQVKKNKIMSASSLNMTGFKTVFLCSNIFQILISVKIRE